MKSWFASSLLWLVTGAAWASPASGLACLGQYDLACAQAAIDPQDTSIPAVRLRAEVDFALGRFPEALAGMQKVAAANPKDEEVAHLLDHYRVTVEATEGFVVERRGDVEIRYLPGTDLVLLDEAFETLQAAHDRIGPMLGGAPPGGVRMEIYPTGERFTNASGLPKEAVETTGVVALSKWTRLLVASPRTLGRGYAWKDTIAHEYIHYIVAWRSKDETPVWLQEGIARSHEGYWRTKDPPHLAPYQEGLLADALANDTLVPLERMHPSMAFLSSADEAALAYAQVSTMVEHLMAVAGDGAVSRTLDEVRGGTDALQAVADVGAAGDIPTFMSGWRDRLTKMKLVSRKLAAAPTVLGGEGDEFGFDPVLSKNRERAGFARIGDLLREAGKYEAALVEYQKATPEDEPPSPALSERRAEALLGLGRDEEAIAVLRASIEDYPETAATRKRLALILMAKGRNADALVQFRAGADINPFDPEVQEALAHLYAASGKTELAQRHARYRRILDLGGEPLKEQGADG